MFFVVRALDRIERRMARGDVCPKCGAETHRVPRNARDRMMAKLVDERVKRRRCLRCSWNGLAI
jgi:hypothetical protein